MQLSDFDFDLPDDLIATRPVFPRRAARMLVAQGGTIFDSDAAHLPEILRPDDVLVINDTRVIPARLTGTRRRISAQGPVEARIEVTLLEPGAAAGSWNALARPMRKLAVGETVRFGEVLSAEVLSMEPLLLQFDAEGPAFDAALNAIGAMPLPPYIAARRKPDARDNEDYQPIWARARGAVAAPTASLHFDEALLQSLDARGIERVAVTLHVGAGTFLPVKVEDVATHRMHAEWGEVSAQAAQRLNDARRAGRRIIAVGTTAARLLESATTEDGVTHPFSADTDIFIYPGYTFRSIDGLMTNFHLPKSTLMMLVSALMGRECVMQIYQHAIDLGYRFFSYGDTSLLIPDPAPKLRGGAL